MQWKSQCLRRAAIRDGDREKLWLWSPAAGELIVSADVITLVPVVLNAGDESQRAGGAGLV